MHRYHVIVITMTPLLAAGQCDRTKISTPSSTVAPVSLRGYECTLAPSDKYRAGNVIQRTPEGVDIPWEASKALRTKGYRIEPGQQTAQTRTSVRTLIEFLKPVGLFSGDASASFSRNLTIRTFYSDANEVFLQFSNPAEANNYITELSQDYFTPNNSLGDNSQFLLIRSHIEAKGVKFNLAEIARAAAALNLTVSDRLGVKPPEDKAALGEDQAKPTSGDICPFGNPGSCLNKDFVTPIPVCYYTKQLGIEFGSQGVPRFVVNDGELLSRPVLAKM